MKKDSGQKGFLGLLVLILVSLVLAKYFYNLDVFQAAGSPQGQQTIGYTHQLLNTIWSYVSAPVTFTWDNILKPIVSLIWDSFQAFLAWGHQTASAPLH